MSAAAEELECRVCRGNAELPNRPLCSPCLCSGSIMYCHQSCLEEWLAHSQKDKCELCGSKYKFTAVYAEDMPSVVPSVKLLASGLKLLFTYFLPLIFRVLLAMFIWLCVVPFLTAEFYRFWIGGMTSYTFKVICGDIISGFVLVGTIALSFVVMMSFADFLRFNWNLGMNNGAAAGGIPQRGGHGNRNIAERGGRRRDAFNRRDNRRVNPNNRMRAPFRRPLNRAMERGRVRDGALVEERRRRDDLSEERGRLQELLLMNKEEDIRETRAGPIDARVLTSSTGEKARGPSAQSVIADEKPEEKTRYDDELYEVLSDGASSLISVPLTETQSSKAYAGSEASADIDNDIKLPMLRGSRSYMRASRDCFEVIGEDDLQDQWKRDKGHLEHRLAGVDEKLAGLDSAAQPHLGEGSSDHAKLESSFAFLEETGYDTLEPNAPVPEGQALALPALFDDVENDPAANEIGNVIFDLPGGVNVDPLNNFQVNMNPNGEPDDFVDPQQVDLEIHLVLDELIGIRAPFGILIRNASWLIVFNGTFIIIFGFVPYCVGVTIYTYVFSELPTIVLSYLCSNPQNVCLPLVVREIYPLSEFIAVVHKLLDLSAASSNIIKLGDVATVFCGYLLLAFSLLSVGALSNAYHATFPRQSLAVVAETIAMVTSVVKVGFLLFLRIFCLPVVLGTIVLNVFNMRTGYSLDQLLAFVARDILSFLYLSWASGISYMLTVTLTMLQLREVLHPRILAHIIRSQEAHLDLLTSLVFDSMSVHFRRILVSMIVYIICLLLFTWTPLALLNIILPHKKALELWYGIPELQIPIELMCSHVVFLAVLDKRKDMIGIIQHKWLVFITKMFGMQRFLLPVLLESAEYIYREELSNAASYVDGSENVRLIRTQEPNRDGAITNDIVICRPPDGWETRGTTLSSRWAWDSEPKSNLEDNLAPVTIPRNWPLKLFGVIFTSWMICIAVVIFLAVVPVAIGSCVQTILRIPSFLRHEPVSFALGVIVITVFLQLLLLVRTHHHRIWRNTVHWYSWPTVSAGLKALFLIEYFIPQAIGISLHMIAIDVDSTAIFTLVSLFQDLCIGAVALAIFFTLLNSLSFEVLENSFGIRYPFVARYERGVEAARALALMASSEIISEHRTQELIADMQLTLITPLAVFWCWQLGYIVLGMTVGYFLHMYFMIVDKQCSMQLASMMLSGGKIGGIAVLGELATIAFFSPIRTCMVDFYNLIRDELYLVGKKLENRTPVSSS